MLKKITTEAMAARLKAYSPSVNNLSVEPTAIGNAILTFRDFIDNEPLQIGLNLFNQYFAPLKSWTELGPVEIEAEISFMLKPAAIVLSCDGRLQQTTHTGQVSELSGLNLVAFAEHLLALYRFWYTSPAFRSAAAQSFFSNSGT